MDQELQTIASGQPADVAGAGQMLHVH